MLAMTDPEVWAPISGAVILSVLTWSIPLVPHNSRRIDRPSPVPFTPSAGYYSTSKASTVPASSTTPVPSTFPPSSMGGLLDAEGDTALYISHQPGHSRLKFTFDAALSPCTAANFKECLSRQVNIPLHEISTTVKPGGHSLQVELTSEANLRKAIHYLLPHVAHDYMYLHMTRYLDEVGDTTVRPPLRKDLDLDWFCGLTMGNGYTAMPNLGRMPLVSLTQASKRTLTPVPSDRGMSQDLKARIEATFPVNTTLRAHGKCEFTVTDKMRSNRPFLLAYWERLSNLVASNEYTHYTATFAIMNLELRNHLNISNLPQAHRYRGAFDNLCYYHAMTRYLCSARYHTFNLGKVPHMATYGGRFIQDKNTAIEVYEDLQGTYELW